MIAAVRSRVGSLSRNVCWCVGLALGLLTALGGGWINLPRMAEQMLDDSDDDGTLLVCGGGVLPDVVRDRFLELAGGRSAKIVVIPAEQATAQHRREVAELCQWTSRGVARVTVIYTTDRARANDPDFYAPLQEATGVWIGGGQQDWLTNLYGGGEVEAQLKQLLARGGVVAGSSAGAAVMSHVMIASGRTAAIEGRGFGLFPGAVVDQHFLKRNRVNRLMGLLQRHPDLVGFGIDEQTALEVRLSDMRLRVIGDSYVVACLPGTDGHHARIEILQRGDVTDLAQLQAPDEAVYAVSDEPDATPAPVTLEPAALDPVSGESQTL